MWFVPLFVILTAVILAIPLGLFMARVLDREEPVGPLERALTTGPQGWRPYCVSLLAFSFLAFVVGFVVLALQPWLPLNPDHKKMLAPSMIFNTACSFLTNTNLQHYSGEQHLSYFSQLVVICWKQFVTPAIGLAAMLAMIRGLRGDRHMGNFYLDLWRGTIYILLPLSFVVALLLVSSGVPMTLDKAEEVTRFEDAVDAEKKAEDRGKQTISRGPVAAIVAIKQLGTNGGGFYGANSAHPLENPTAFSNLVECISIILIPLACLVLFGRMIGNQRHAAIIAGVLFLFLVSLLIWAVVTDSLTPNPAFAAHPPIPGADTERYAVGLPVEQEGTGNLEGKELRFGRTAAATWATLTTCTSNGSVNCNHDSLNPLASLSPFAGMWLNCIFGGVGVGLINLLVYLIVGVFLSGLMVGRTPEYLGKKVEAREMKLAMLALLFHPILILAPAGLFAVRDWGAKATGNPGAHGLSEMLYEFSSSMANNGSEFSGLGNTVGYYVPEGKQDDNSPFVDPDKNPVPPAPYGVYWDIATGVVMLLGRFVPILAPIALAAGLAGKKPTPFTAGTLRTDTMTFGFVLLGTIVLIGALLFMPVAMLGPVADHLGPTPFGG
jgi:K+-transporting ATPase ATPase A chain